MLRTDSAPSLAPRLRNTFTAVGLLGLSGFMLTGCGQQSITGNTEEYCVTFPVNVGRGSGTVYDAAKVVILDHLDIPENLFLDKKYPGINALNEAATATLLREHDSSTQAARVILGTDVVGMHFVVYDSTNLEKGGEINHLEDLTEAYDSTVEADAAGDATKLVLRRDCNTTEILGELKP